MLDGIQNLSSLQLLSNTQSLFNNNTSQTSAIFDILLLSLLQSTKEQIQQEIKNEVSSQVQSYLEDAGNVNSASRTYNTSKTSSTSNSSENFGKELQCSDKIASIISKASKKYGVDEKLIRSVIKIESDFNPNVVSSAGATGLMQVIPQNYSYLGITDPSDIEQNVNGGTKELKDLLDRFDGNVEMALMGYNGGIGRMAQRGVKSPSDVYKMPTETQNYVKKVMNLYKS